MKFFGLVLLFVFWPIPFLLFPQQAFTKTQSLPSKNPPEKTLQTKNHEKQFLNSMLIVVTDADSRHSKILNATEEIEIAGLVEQVRSVNPLLARLLDCGKLRIVETSSISDSTQIEFLSFLQ